MPCLVPEACLGGPGSPCAPGYTSKCTSGCEITDKNPTGAVRCSACDKDYYPSKDTPGLCLACPSQGNLMILLIANVGLWLMVAMAGWWLRDSTRP